MAVSVCARDEIAPLKDTVSDIAKDSSPPATDVRSGVETLTSASASSFPTTAAASDNCSKDGGKNDTRPDDASASATNCLNMDDIMEYLQCQDTSLLENNAHNVSSVHSTLSGNFTSSDGNNPALSLSDNLTSSTLSLAALQQLASECSTIDLSSLGMDSSMPFVASNGPVSGK